MTESPEFHVKKFDELTARELYEILRLRAEIFVVEQNCVYQDLDGKDQESLHVYSTDEKGFATSCLRIFRRGPETAQIGRVVTRHHGTGLGGRLLKRGIAEAEAWLAPQRIYLEAQVYAIGYYAREGFRVCSAEFILDGIPHVKMVLEL